MDMFQKAAFLAALSMAAMLIGIGFAAGSGGAQAALATTPTPTPLPDPVMGELDLDAIAQIDLTTYPIVPEIGEQALRIYADSLARGSNPHTFVKIGDCMTHNPYFLLPIGEGDYDLGEYQDLQPVIDYFAEGELNSFARESQATAGGFNSASVLDSLWANPEFCEAGETPLTCEFRAMQPSIALIMFGTNDVFYLDEPSFDFFMRSIVVETIRNGALPILSTFPHRPEFPDKSVLYNQIVVQIAQDYDLPLINLWLALEPLPNQGIDLEEPTRMSAPESGGACYFIAPNLEAGFTVRNLVTLQTLDAVLKAAEQE
jgi:hypothetical protein